jgi:EAL domain-containing protein (putative c-di-GMP-specific phosphodiesterase class I)
MLTWLGSHPEHVEKLSLCSINLSGQSLGSEEFMVFVERTLDETRLPAERLCFEITETAAIASLEAALQFMRRLKKRGCRFALDDFGAGLSSFGYLKTLPVDYLKIDGSFVSRLADSPPDRAIVHSANEVGHIMGMETIAEFVENDTILAVLRDLGVDYAQGYGVARPEVLVPARTGRPVAK